MSTPGPRKPSPVNLVAVHRSPALGQRRPGAVLDRLLSRPDAARLVRQMPELELYFVIREIGLADALDLLRLCSPEQVQAFLDIDCWQQDRLDPDRAQTWLEALTELGHQRLGLVVQRLDHEFLITFLQHRVRVYDFSSEEPPEEPAGHFYYTPDRFYVVDVLPQEAHGAASDHLIDRLLDSLYMADLELGRRVVMGAKWDAGAETEETAYRFRSGRMADLGYVDYHEALKVYAYLDPQAVRLFENTAPPAPQGGGGSEGLELVPAELLEVLHEPTAFGRAAMALPPPDREHLFRHLLLLINQVLSADRADPGDLQAARPLISRAAAYLSLAVEYLSRPSARAPATTNVPAAAPETESLAAPETEEERAQAALRTVALSRLFRLGYSLTVRLSRLAAVLSERGLVSLLGKQDPASLLPEPYGDVVRLLLDANRRPQYSTLLDSPPTPGARPFLTLLDIARTAHVLEGAGALGRYLTIGLGMRQDNLVQVLQGTSPALPEVRLTHFLGTLAANLLLKRPASMVPLSRQDLPALRQGALGLGAAAAELSPAARSLVLTTFQQRVHERSLSEEEARSLWTPAVERLVGDTLAQLGRSLAALPADLDPAQADAVAALDGLVLR